MIARLIIDTDVKKELDSGYYFNFLAKIKLKNGQWLYNVRIINKNNFIKGFTNHLEKLSKKEKIIFGQNEYPDPFEKQDTYIGDELERFISFDNIISEFSLCEICKYENFVSNDFIKKLGESNEYTEEYFPEYFWIFTLEFKNGKMISVYLRDHEKSDGNENGVSFERHVYLPDNLLIKDISTVHTNKVILDGKLVDYEDYIMKHNLFDALIDLDSHFICPISNQNNTLLTRADFLTRKREEYFNFDENEEDLPF
ncbi:hypothetical protein [Soonwooa sp.]|uniref:hypothetical protein n=1 Tax=Soonwooa sp. TaxID=1938592 RepID=UPI00289F352B|nr:hypothetical protein [Soonwooa sp.]